MQKEVLFGPPKGRKKPLKGLGDLIININDTAE